MDDKNREKPLDIEDGGKKRDEGLGAALGICYGSALGMLGMALTGELWLMPIGISLGLMLGLLLGAAKKHDRKGE